MKDKTKDKIKNELLAFGIALVAALVIMGCSVVMVNKNIYNLASDKAVVNTDYKTSSDTDAAADLKSAIDATIPLLP